MADYGAPVDFDFDISSAQILDFSNPADRKLKAGQQALYVKEVWWFLASVIAAVSLLHYASLVLQSLRRRSLLVQNGQESEGIGPGTGRTSLRRVPVAILSGLNIVLNRWTIPIGTHSVASVAEALIVCGYVCALLTWEFIHTKNLQRYFWEDRAAHLASCQIPLIVALASKNNILTLLTGVSHEQLNVLHRAAGRMCLLLLWVHAMTRYQSGLQHFPLTLGWMRAGVLGLTALTLAFFLSLRPVRKMAFEFFFFSHIILIAAFIIGGYVHAQEVDFGIYFWPGMIVWCFDRAVRTLRVLYFNRLWFGFQKAQASAELLAHDSVRLTFRRPMSWKPGQHVYLNIPGVSASPGEMHPFTIASIPDDTNKDGNKLVCIIRARNGMTRRLRDHLSSSSNGTKNITVVVDGPYGSPPNVTSSSSVVLIAGGSGITFILPLLEDLLRRAQNGASPVKRIVWIWTVRGTEHLEWIDTALRYLTAKLPSRVFLDARVYVTSSSVPVGELQKYQRSSNSGAGTPSVISSDDEKKLESDQHLESPAYQTIPGRPDVESLLEDVVTTSEGHVSVCVAGPSTLAQAVRRTLRSKLVSPSSILKGRPTVDLHTEAFGTVRG